MTTNSAILFDLDGTLLDVSERYFQLFRDFCSLEQHSPILDKSDYWQNKRNRYSEADYLTAAGLPDSAKRWPAFQLEHIESPKYLRFDSVWPGLHPFLSTVSKERSLFLVTFRRRRRPLLEQLAELGLSPYFTDILSPAEDDGTLLSPSAELKAGLVRARFPKPFNGWFVGDTETDIQCGRKLGLRTGAAEYGIRDFGRMGSTDADVRFTSPEELAEWRPTHD